MRLTKFGHSCLLVEESGARVLLDPGSFSDGFEALEGLTAVCLTHQHPDHLDAERLRRVLDRSPGVRVVSDEGSWRAISGADMPLAVRRRIWSSRGVSRRSWSALRRRIS